MGFEDIWIPYIDYFIDRKCLPSWSLPIREINFHDLTYLVSGEAEYYVNGKAYHLKKGDMIYIPAGNTREAQTFKQNPMHCYAFNFQLSVSPGKATNLPIPTVFHIQDDFRLLSLCKEFNACWLEKSSGFLQQSTALLMLILHLVLKINSKDGAITADPRLNRVKEYILTHYQQKLSLAELAGISGLHPVYFGSWFQKSTDLSVKAYINNIRINKARDLLSTGGYTVSNTAYRCGFDDPFYFSKVFKKLTGQSPSRIKQLSEL